MFGGAPNGKQQSDDEESSNADKSEERTRDIVSVEEKDITVQLPKPQAHLPPFYEDKWDSYHVKYLT